MKILHIVIALLLITFSSVTFAEVQQCEGAEELAQKLTQKMSRKYSVGPFSLNTWYDKTGQLELIDDAQAFLASRRVAVNRFRQLAMAEGTWDDYVTYKLSDNRIAYTYSTEFYNPETGPLKPSTVQTWAAIFDKVDGWQICSMLEAKADEAHKLEGPVMVATRKTPCRENPLAWWGASRAKIFLDTLEKHGFGFDPDQKVQVNDKNIVSKGDLKAWLDTEVEMREEKDKKSQYDVKRLRLDRVALPNTKELGLEYVAFLTIYALRDETIEGGPSEYYALVSDGGYSGKPCGTWQLVKK